MGNREAGGIVLILLGIAAAMMAVNGTMARVWADLRGVNGPDGAVGTNGPNPNPGPSTGGIPQSSPAPSPGQPPAPSLQILSGFPGSGVRTNA